MAKNKPRPDDDFDDAPVPPVALPAGLVELPAPAAAQQPERPFLWRVSLNCPTPLLHKSLEVGALTEQEAKQKFLAANGISDSVHPFVIERLREL